MFRQISGRLKERALIALGALSPRTAAWCDWQRRSVHQSFGGPLNGQQCRQALVRRLVAEVKPDRIIETGTFRGTSTLFLWSISECPIYSVEINPRYYYYALTRLKGLPRISLNLRDSRDWLRESAEELSRAEGPVFAYLDAHWENILPLEEEISLLLESAQSPLILIDDFEVPGDPGYMFDSYGGLPLSRESFKELLSAKTILYPGCSSEEETGSRRGCALIVPDDLVDQALRAGFQFLDRVGD